MLKKKNIYTGRIINLSRELVKLPNGRKRWFETVEHPGSVGVVPMLTRDKVVLIRQFRHAAGKFIWEIPAGTREKGEAPISCARREIIEEIGFKARNMKKLISIRPTPGFCNEVLDLFKATSLIPAAQKLEDDECIEKKVFKIDTAINMIYKTVQRRFI
jgi:ADP-ribose pyrophosphatase